MSMAMCTSMSMRLPLLGREADLGARVFGLKKSTKLHKVHSIQKVVVYFHIVECIAFKFAGI